MSEYINGTLIRELREKKKLTQAELAKQLNVSDKAVSKWETGKGYPDISLVMPLSAALGVSVIELFSGNAVTNQNRSCNMKKVKFYVCPICGNVLFSTGAAVMSCCGLTLPSLEAELPDEEHQIRAETVEDEYYITAAHDMTKTHFVSFFAAVKDNGIEFVKLYPEQACEARFKISRTDRFYWYCNRHGLFSASVRELEK